MELIDVTRIEKKRKDYYNLLKDKYELIFKNQIQSLEGEELNKTVKITSEFISRIFLKKGDNSFLDENICKLDDKIKFLLYKELMKIYNGKKIWKNEIKYILDISKQIRW